MQAVVRENTAGSIDTSKSELVEIDDNQNKDCKGVLADNVQDNTTASIPPSKLYNMIMSKTHQRDEESSDVEPGDQSEVVHNANSNQELSNFLKKKFTPAHQNIDEKSSCQKRAVIGVDQIRKVAKLLLSYKGVLAP